MWSAELCLISTTFSCLTSSTKKISSLSWRCFAKYPVSWSFKKHRRIEQLVSAWVNERASGWVGDACVQALACVKYVHLIKFLVCAFVFVRLFALFWFPLTGNKTPTPIYRANENFVYQVSSNLKKPISIQLIWTEAVFSLTRQRSQLWEEFTK